MAVLLITYDLSDDSNRDNVLQAIKNFSTYTQLSESSYVVKTGNSPKTVNDRLNRYFSPKGDQLFVVTLQHGSWWGRGKGPTAEAWMKLHLGG